MNNTKGRCAGCGLRFVDGICPSSLCRARTERRREQAPPAPPQSFLTEAEAQQKRRIENLEDQLAEERAAAPIRHFVPLVFRKGDRNYVRAAIVAADLGHPPELQVVFRPMDSQWLGAWRIEAGNWEWYVDEKILFEVWERAGAQLAGSGS